MCLITIKFHGSRPAGYHHVMFILWWLRCYDLLLATRVSLFKRSIIYGLQCLGYKAMTLAENVCEVCVQRKGCYPVAARWFWQVTLLWSYTLRVWCDAVLCSSWQPDCRSSPNHLLLFPGFHTCANVLWKTIIFSYAVSYIQQVSKSGGQLLLHCRTAKERGCMLGRHCCRKHMTQSIMSMHTSTKFWTS